MLPVRRSQIKVGGESEMSIAGEEDERQERAGLTDQADDGPVLDELPSTGWPSYYPISSSTITSHPHAMPMISHLARVVAKTTRTDLHLLWLPDIEIDGFDLAYVRAHGSVNP